MKDKIHFDGMSMMDGDPAEGGAMFHPMAMSDDPVLALAGRALKDIVNAVDDWWGKEVDRAPVTGEQMLLALPTIVTNIVSLVVQRLAQQCGVSPAAQADMLEQQGKVISRALRFAGEGIAARIVEDRKKQVVEAKRRSRAGANSH